MIRFAHISFQTQGFLSHDHNVTFKCVICICGVSSGDDSSFPLALPRLWKPVSATLAKNERNNDNNNKLSKRYDLIPNYTEQYNNNNNNNNIFIDFFSEYDDDDCC